VVVPDQLTNEDWRAVPSFDARGRTGSPLRVVPERVGELTADLLRRDFEAGAGWSRTG
jgi:hypothetical protein